jgi:ubiquitin-protein ligase/DNA-directed RNA polymerase subunit RPC12/RpoP
MRLGHGQIASEQGAIMISFACNHCGKTFSVPDTFAGRTAKCKVCGTMLTVPVLPAVEPPTVTSPITGKVPMRTRRLRADAEAMATAFRNFEAIKATPLAGDPPESYRVDYSITSLERGPDGKPQFRKQHSIEIQLTSEYPRLSPKCKMLTPIFHPNIDPASICVGDHWTAGERLVDLVVRIGEMIGYQAYNIQSPLDGEAAMWADLHRDQLPTDKRDLRPAEL